MLRTHADYREAKRLQDIADDLFWEFRRLREEYIAAQEAANEAYEEAPEC